MRLFVTVVCNLTPTREKTGNCGHVLGISGKRKQGRPQKTWRATFKEDQQAMGVTWRGAAGGRNSSPNVPERTRGTRSTLHFLAFKVYPRIVKTLNLFNFP